MDSTVQALASVLENELEVHEQLLNLAHQMRESILNREIESVKRITTLYDEDIEKLEKLEADRARLCSTLVPDSQATFQTIIMTLPQQGKTTLIRIRSKLKKKVMEIKAVLIANELLLQEALYAIQYSVTAAALDPVQQKRYHKSGKPEPETTRQVWVNRLA